MSPDEDQLRAALHDGEGEYPDQLNPDHIISRARQERRQRRQSIRATIGVAAAVVLVAGGGYGISQLGHGSSEKSSSASDRTSVINGGGDGLSLPGGAASSPGAPAPAASGSSAAASGEGGPVGSPVQTQAPDASALPAPCPTTPSALPAAPLPTAAGADGPLFSANLSSLTICVYSVNLLASNSEQTLTGARAQQLAATFNALPPVPDNEACTADLGPTVLMLPKTPAGPGKAVAANLGGCGLTTNGTAIRNARAELAKLAR